MFLGPAGQGALFSGFEGAGAANTAVAGFAAGAISTGTFQGAMQGAFTAEMFYSIGQGINGYIDGAGNIKPDIQKLRLSPRLMG
jgi:hypothetical protein